MLPTGTQVHYYIACMHKLWLFRNQITMEHASERVEDGRLIHETSYGKRATEFTELMIDGNKIDFYDARNKIIHETKRSDKVEEANTWQLKHYLYVLEKNGIEGARGILEYPKLRQCTEIQLEKGDRSFLESAYLEIARIGAQENCPPKVRAGLCKSCAYHDFCWVEEVDHFSDTKLTG